MPKSRAFSAITRICSALSGSGLGRLRSVVGMLWSTTARVFSGARTLRPVRRKPSKAFGATDIFRHPDEDGKRLFHARMTINGGTVMISDDYSKEHGGPPAPTPEKPAPVAVSIALDSPDQVDALFRQAVAAGGNGVV